MQCNNFHHIQFVLYFAFTVSTSNPVVWRLLCFSFSLNDAEFLEISLELIVQLDGDGVLVADVGHVDAVVEALSLIEQHVRWVDVHLILTHLLHRDIVHQPSQHQLIVSR